MLGGGSVAVGALGAGAGGFAGDSGFDQLSSHFDQLFRISIN